MNRVTSKIVVSFKLILRDKSYNVRMVLTLPKIHIRFKSSDINISIRR